ncbi:MAG: PorP/SprF family type IX secretion system membrane protein [Bacteroidales bacterium]|mgnify:CR=1 FL=1|nr:PorP/SprF family type IX secretion system membrane protein [Bacteroidales bacterium]HQP04005.1 PorP/SprF family type IX secretion system membrane protein [Bacteroidales bacterium]
MRRFYIILFLITVSGLINAQQLPQFRYQDFNAMFLNPANINKFGTPDIFLNHRSQWVGFSGAPITTTLAGKYSFRDDMAAGLIVSNDLTGTTRRLFLNLNYAYLLKTEVCNISFGLAWTVVNYRVRGDLMTIHEQNDNSVLQNINDAAWKPDANIGVLFFSDKFYTGFGIQQVLKSKFRFYETGETFGSIVSARHYFIHGGVYLRPGYEEHLLTPHTNLYFTGDTPFKFDLGINYLYQNKISLSLLFSYGDAVVLQAGYRFKQFLVSYSYDMVISTLKNVSSGAHEITLALYLKNPEQDKGSMPSF